MRVNLVTIFSIVNFDKLDGGAIGDVNWFRALEKFEVVCGFGFSPLSNACKKDGILAAAAIANAGLTACAGVGFNAATAAAAAAVLKVVFVLLVIFP